MIGSAGAHSAMMISVAMKTASAIPGIHRSRPRQCFKSLQTPYRNQGGPMNFAWSLIRSRKKSILEVISSL